MLHIAVCDPNTGHRAALCDALAKLLFDGADYRFSCFSSGDALLEQQGQEIAFQLVFLEIRLEGPLNGLETAEQLRYRSPGTDIIFLTGAAEYIGAGYRYHRSVQLPLHQIYYLESQRRKIIAHMVEDQVEFYGRLDALEELLGPSGFLRCHQSYLVNLRYIRQLGSSSLTLPHNCSLPVSRPYLKSLRSALEPEA